MITSHGPRWLVNVWICLAHFEHLIWSFNRPYTATQSLIFACVYSLPNPCVLCVRPWKWYLSMEPFSCIQTSRNETKPVSRFYSCPKKSRTKLLISLLFWRAFFSSNQSIYYVNVWPMKWTRFPSFWCIIISYGFWERAKEKRLSAPGHKIYENMSVRWRQMQLYGPKINYLTRFYYFLKIRKIHIHKEESISFILMFLMLHSDM